VIPNLFTIFNMAVKEYYAEEQSQQSPWVQTPLRESYALSEAAGWYGHTSPVILTPPPPFEKGDF
jgi:hypothetical protein